MATQQRPRVTGKPLVTNDESRDWWSLPEFATRMGISRNTAHTLALRGEIPGAVRLGRQWRISKVAYLRHLHGEAGAA